MMQPVGPLNAFVPHIDPKTGKFTTEGYNYFNQLATTVNSQATTVSQQSDTIKTLQDTVAQLQKGLGH